MPSTLKSRHKRRAVHPRTGRTRPPARRSLGEDGSGRGGMVVHDIRETEKALRESERRLSRTQQIAHLGSWELDLVGGDLTWSDEVYRIFNLKPRQFKATYEGFLERVHPADRAAVDAAYSGSLREGKDTYEIEHRIVRRGTREIRWVREKCHHIRNAKGKIIRSVGMVMDITERKIAEEKIRRLNEELERRVEERMQEIEILRNRDRTTLKRLNDMINNVHVGMLAIDENGMILHVNNHYRDMFRLSGRHPILGMHIRKLVKTLRGTFVQPEEVERTVDNALRHLPVRGSEVQLRDGRTISRDYLPIFD
ncbi:MAG: PAS domain-containing protein, partial [Patescibacteria group bacterium]